MANQELWKEVAGYHNYYEVSNFGRVRSLERTVNAPYGRRRILPSVMLKQNKASHGYLMVGLACNGKAVMVLVHRLVAEAFINNTNDRRTINHIDGVKIHNGVTNLEWATDGENMSHAYRLGLNYNGEQTLKTGKDATFCKYSVRAISDTKEIIVSGTKEMIDNGFTPSSVWRCLNGRRKTHKGFTFSKVTV